MDENDVLYARHLPLLRCQSCRCLCPDDPLLRGRQYRGLKPIAAIASQGPRTPARRSGEANPARHLAESAIPWIALSYGASSLRTRTRPSLCVTPYVLVVGGRPSRSS